MKFLQFFRHKKDSGGMSSYRVKEFLAVICILVTLGSTMLLTNEVATHSTLKWSGWKRARLHEIMSDHDLRELASNLTVTLLVSSDKLWGQRARNHLSSVPLFPLKHWDKKSMKLQITFSYQQIHIYKQLIFRVQGNTYLLYYQAKQIVTSAK